MFTVGKAAFLIDGSWKVGGIVGACQSDPEDPSTLDAEKLAKFDVTCFDLLTVLFELIHCVVAVRFGYACFFKNFCIEEHCLPESIYRYCILAEAEPEAEAPAEATGPVELVVTTTFAGEDTNAQNYKDAVAVSSMYLSYSVKRERVIVQFVLFCLLLFCWHVDF